MTKDNFKSISDDFEYTSPCCTLDGFAASGSSGYSSCCGFDGKNSKASVKFSNYTGADVASAGNAIAQNQTKKNNLNNFGKNLNPDEIQAGAEAAAAIAAAIATRQKTAIQLACGRKPLFGKQKKAVYNQCVANYNAPPVPPDSGTRNTREGMSTGEMFAWGFGGLAVLGLGIFAVVKLKAKPKVNQVITTS